MKRACTVFSQKQRHGHDYDRVLPRFGRPLHCLGGCIEQQFYRVDCHCLYAKEHEGFLRKSKYYYNTFYCKGKALFTLVLFKNNRAEEIEKDFKSTKIDMSN